MKKYLNNFEDLRKAYDICNSLQSEIFNHIYDESMDQLNYEIDYLGVSGLRYHSHYTSFFYTIDDRKSFLSSVLHHVDFCFYFGYTEEQQAKLLKAFNHFEYEMSYDSKQYDNLDSYLDRKADELKDKYEEYLHSFENQVYDDDFINDCISNYLIEDYSNCFILDNDYSRIYGHIPGHYIKASGNCIYG